MSTNTNRIRDWAVEAAEAAMLLIESPALDDAGKVVTDSTELMWLIADRIRETYAAEQPAAHPAYIDVEAMLAACVPGGSVADPQAISDAIRAWVAEQPAAQEAVGYTQMTVGGWAVATLYYQALNLPAGTKLYTRPAEPAAAPDGFVIAPVKPTAAMIAAGYEHVDKHYGDVCDAYAAMLAAREGQ